MITLPQSAYARPRMNDRYHWVRTPRRALTSAEAALYLIIRGAGCITRWQLVTALNRALWGAVRPGAQTLNALQSRLVRDGCIRHEKIDL